MTIKKMRDPVSLQGARNLSPGVGLAVVALGLSLSSCGVSHDSPSLADVKKDGRTVPTHNIPAPKTDTNQPSLPPIKTSVPTNASPVNPKAPPVEKPDTVLKVMVPLPPGLDLKDIHAALQAGRRVPLSSLPTGAIERVKEPAEKPVETPEQRRMLEILKKAGIPVTKDGKLIRSGK